MSTLQKLPPFITDAFVLKILLDLNGKASSSQIKAHVSASYDSSGFPHAIQYIFTQYGNLAGHGYLDMKRDKQTGETVYWIKADALEVAVKMVKSKFGKASVS